MGQSHGATVIQVVPSVSLDGLHARADAVRAAHSHEWTQRQQRILYTNGAFCANDARIVETAHSLNLPLLTINKRMTTQTNPGRNALRWHLWQDKPRPLRLVVLDNQHIDSVPALVTALVAAGAAGPAAA